MKLFYPLESGKTECVVKQLKTKIIKIVSDKDNVKRGFIADVLSSICDLTKEECLELSIADMYQIVYESFILTHGVKLYTDWVLCDTVKNDKGVIIEQGCGQMNPIVHNIDITGKYTPDEVYFKEHMIGTHKVKFYPPKVSTLENMTIGKNLNFSSSTQIKEYDGKKDFDSEDLDLATWKITRQLLEKDQVATDSTFCKNAKCKNCNRILQSLVGLHNVKFLQNIQ
jgi:hypothetical protein